MFNDYIIETIIISVLSWSLLSLTRALYDMMKNRDHKFDWTLISRFSVHIYNRNNFAIISNSQYANNIL